VICLFVSQNEKVPYFLSLPLRSGRTAGVIQHRDHSNVKAHKQKKFEQVNVLSLGDSKLIEF